MKEEVEDPTVVVKFRPEVRVFVNEHNWVSICTVDYAGEEESIEVEHDSLRALGNRLIQIANAEGV